jgi:hypothetical protein
MPKPTWLLTDGYIHRILLVLFCDYLTFVSGNNSLAHFKRIIKTGWIFRTSPSKTEKIRNLDYLFWIDISQQMA